MYALQIDTLMNPLKTSMKSVTQAVKTMPDNMLSTVDGVMDNLSKFFGNPKKTSIFYENTKVGASLDTEVLSRSQSPRSHTSRKTTDIKIARCI